jgi:hypothetical protein
MTSIGKNTHIVVRFSGITKYKFKFLPPSLAIGPPINTKVKNKAELNETECLGFTDKRVAKSGGCSFRLQLCL